MGTYFTIVCTCVCSSVSSAKVSEREREIGPQRVPCTALWRQKLTNCNVHLLVLSSPQKASPFWKNERAVWRRRWGRDWSPEKGLPFMVSVDRTSSATKSSSCCWCRSMGRTPTSVTSMQEGKQNKCIGVMHVTLYTHSHTHSHAQADTHTLTHITRHVDACTHALYITHTHMQHVCLKKTDDGTFCVWGVFYPAGRVAQNHQCPPPLLLRLEED